MLNVYSTFTNNKCEIIKWFQFPCFPRYHGYQICGKKILVSFPIGTNKQFIDIKDKRAMLKI